MSGAVIFGCSVLLYAGLTLLFALRRSAIRYLLLYSHVAALNVLASLLGSLYVTEVAGVSVPAGQVAYAALIFTAVVTLVVGRDIQVLRNVVALTISVNVLVYVAFHLAAAALTAPGVLNPSSVSPAVFDLSLRTILGGTALTVVELVSLLVVIELAKTRLGTRAMAAAYVAGFALVLVIDGVLFPLVVRAGEDALASLILEGAQAKLLLAVVYAVPLLVFVALDRPTVSRFEAVSLPLRDLLSLSLTRDPLLEQLDATTQQAGQAEATVSGILDAARSTILATTDTDFRLTRFNQGAERLLGWRESEVLGQTPDLFRPLRDGPGTSPEEHRQRWLELADGAYRDAEYRTRDGARVVFSISLNEIRDGETLLGYLAAGEDITERARIEAAQAETVQRLEDADRVKDELVSTISHELRTPITSIQGYTELLVDGSFGDLDAAQGDALSKIERNVIRLQALVDDLLFVARGQSAEERLALVPLDLRDPLAAAWDTVEQLAHHRELRLSCEVPPDPVVVRGDALVLERLVLNLAGNAVKFTPDAGSVRARLRMDDVEVVLVIRDDGMGIPREDLDKIFDRFFRSSEANDRQIPGSGLGLNVAQRIVTMHHGRIHLDSEVGRGTTVTVSLPRWSLG